MSPEGQSIHSWSATLVLKSAKLIRFAAMKGRFIVITSSDNKTVYVPVSRLLRIEAVPAKRDGTVPLVTIVFEGCQVNIQTSQSTETVAADLYERLVGPDDIDLVSLRPDAGKGINDIRVGFPTG